MKSLLTLIVLFVTTSAFTQDIVQEYIQHWKAFYPGDALQIGMHKYAFLFEDISNSKIDHWIDYNRSVLQEIESNKPAEISSLEINKRLLKSQVLSEIHQWENEKPQHFSLDFYNKIFSKAINRPDRVDFLTQDEILFLKSKAYQSITSNCQHLISNLKSINDPDPDKSIRQLQSTLSKAKKHRSDYEPTIHLSNLNQNLVSKIDLTIDFLSLALSHIDTIPNTPMSPILSREEYAKRLAIYTDSDLSPEQLESMTLHEIKVTKELMKEVSLNYLKSNYPNQSKSVDDDEIIKLALDDMEKDVVYSAQEYLEFWEKLAQDASNFIDQKQIATLPEYSTLRIMTAPESAGPAARIGWVASAPPFDPNPVTTLYLPSIPDTLPQQEQIDFWSSFNKPFNRMIVIHELIPGHYMQLKISRETPYPIRLMFPYGPYIEGWATFCEMIALDHGWEKERPLTYLAHLRKRLENANRAYTSVMVHCNGWTEEDVMKFSTETSLLAPQFAKSLWGRLMRSPMQITSYFYGGLLFKKLYNHEQERLGEKFILKHFMDTIMKAGPIPVEEFYDIFDGER